MVKRKNNKQHKSRFSHVMLGVIVIALIGSVFYAINSQKTDKEAGNVPEVIATSSNSEHPARTDSTSTTQHSSTSKKDDEQTSELSKEEFAEIMEEAIATRGVSLEDKEYSWSRCISSALFEDSSNSSNLAGNRALYLATLKNSPIYQERLAYALFNEHGTSSSEPNTIDKTGPIDRNPELTKLLDFYQNEKNDSKVANAIIRNCTSKKDERCTDTLIEEVTNADKHNGRTWLNALSYWAKNNNRDKALNAVKELSISSEFNEHIANSIKLYVDVLDNNSYGDSTFSFGSNYISAVGLTAHNPLTIQHVQQWCINNPDDPVIIDACAVVGQNLYSRGQSIILKSIGQGLLHYYYEALDDQEAVDEIIANRITGDAMAPASFADMTMVMLDEKLGRQFLDTYIQKGELAVTNNINKIVTDFYEQDSNVICAGLYKTLKQMD